MKMTAFINTNTVVRVSSVDELFNCGRSFKSSSLDRVNSVPAQASCSSSKVNFTGFRAKNIHSLSLSKSRFRLGVVTPRRTSQETNVEEDPSKNPENVEEDGEFDDGYFTPDNADSLMDGELLQGDILHSTTKHRVIMGVGAALASALFVQGAIQTSAEAAVLAVLAGYYFADFGSGVFHWSVDNYGNDKTPLVGGTIAAFQGHHMYPWTITKREFCNNVHKVAIPTLPFMVASLAAPLPGFLDIFVSVACVLVVMSQQFHSWSHTRKSQLPAPVVLLQDMGVLVSRKSHGQHHRKPFGNNYCIVSGAWNSTLDESGFFTKLENKIHDLNGVEPRCWNEPDYSWLKGDA